MRRKPKGQASFRTFFNLEINSEAVERVAVENIERESTNVCMLHFKKSIYIRFKIYLEKQHSLYKKQEINTRNAMGRGGRRKKRKGEALRNGETVKARNSAWTCPRTGDKIIAHEGRKRSAQDGLIEI